MVSKKLLILLPILIPPVLAAENVPKDVAEFLKRGELCEHFRQEPWPEGGSEEAIERREFIAKQIEDFCTGLPAAGSNLREKYQEKSFVIEKLNEAMERADELTRAPAAEFGNMPRKYP